MTPSMKVLSALVTVALLVGAVRVGADAPRSPAELARRTTAARENLDRAVAHTDASIDRTAAFAAVARNVQSQLRSSRLLLEIQLDLEATSERTERLSREARAELVRLRSRYEQVAQRLDALTGLSDRAGEATTGSAEAGEALLVRLTGLKERFRKVVRQSKRLNRKARAFGDEGGHP